MITIIYLHGFKSSGDGNKAQQLRTHFKDTVKVIAPNLPANPTEVISQVSNLIRSINGPVILVGTSLGGFYATVISARFDIPAFIINPSLKPYETLLSKVGIHKRYGSDEDYEFKEEYLQDLKSLFTKLSTSNLNSSNIYIYLADDDEVLNFDDIDSVIPYRKTLKRFKSAGHRFNKFPAVIKDIESQITVMNEILKYPLDGLDILI
jgi:predicted esterase YcpF (UPF0227 family)